MAPFKNWKTQPVLCLPFVFLLIQHTSGLHDEYFNQYTRIFPGNEYQVKSDEFAVYCYHGNKVQPATYFYVFGCLEVLFSPQSGVNNCDLIIAENETLVHQRRDTPNFLTLAWKQLFQSVSSVTPTTDHIKLSPFTKTCFGLEGNRITIKAKLRMFEPRYIALCLVGVVLFLQADRLSRSVIFYYGTGISAGVILSLLIFVYVLGKFVPAKKAMATFVLFGWSFSLYVIKWLWDKIFIDRALPEGTHIKVVLAYIILSALISFAVCYRYGPVTEQRTLTLIKWSIWFVSWLLIYNSTQVPEVSISLIAILWTWSILPKGISSGAIRKWRIWFPPKIKLLTEEEYIIQGERETRLALQQLRQFCRSPNCNAWDTIGRLKSPSRFAKFMSGEEFHVSDGEFAAHVIDSDSSFNSQREDRDGHGDASGHESGPSGHSSMDDSPR